MIDDVIFVDQSPIGRTPRSNPVTYIKAYDAIREVFAANEYVENERLYAVAFFVQCSRRTLRNLSGQRHGDGRNAVSRRCRIDLRRLSRHTL